jgi:hypothetical protein
LQKARKDLTILTGSMVVVEAVTSSDKTLGDLSDSRLVRKYFQVGNEDEEDAAAAAVEPSIDPSELWQQVGVRVTGLL